MALPIILDKSSFQGLNYNNIIELHRYYIVNVTPLLVKEILGDLSLENKEGEKLTKEIVVYLAKKMFPYNSYVNMEYDILIEKSLLGEFIENGNRPFLSAEKSISAQGRKGLTFKETKEEVALKRWKNGEFNSIEEIKSNLWRNETTLEDVITDFKKQFVHLADIKAKNKQSNDEKLKELKTRFFERINIEIEPEESLRIILDYFKITEEIREIIVARWKSKTYKDLETFAPYAHYCYSIVSMYFLGINNNIYGEKSTNLLDLQYLFYMPFTKVFSTNDRFLKSLFFAIKPKSVSFISLRDLKSDLSKFQALNSPEKWSEIPPDKNTETYRMWNENYDLKLSEILKPTEKDLERAKKEMDEIIELAKTGQAGKFDGEPDFLVKTSYYSLNDPCPCKSGKTLGECHMKGREL